MKAGEKYRENTVQLQGLIQYPIKRQLEDICPKHPDKTFLSLFMLESATGPFPQWIGSFFFTSNSLSYHALGYFPVIDFGHLCKQFSKSKVLKIQYFVVLLVEQLYLYISNAYFFLDCLSLSCSPAFFAVSHILFPRTKIHCGLFSAR